MSVVMFLATYVNDALPTACALYSAPLLLFCRPLFKSSGCAQQSSVSARAALGLAPTPSDGFVLVKCWRQKRCRFPQPARERLRARDARE
jgi:hypothetical protein